MPTTYAHYRFGTQVRKSLAPEVESVISKYPDLFYFGVHGPDLLFYYNALSKNKVNRLGSRIHELPGRDFFMRAAKALKEFPEEKKEAAYSYLYGFLCHYILDVCCHGYIQEKIDASGITHSEIEAEMDREFLVLDGKDPVRQKLTGHLKPSLESAEIISPFFEDISVEEIRKTMKDMVMYLDLLVLPGKVKRGIVLFLLKLVGHYEGMHGLIINYEKNPDCADSTAKLLDLYEKAVGLAAEKINGFAELAKQGGSFDGVYEYNFSSVHPETGEVFGVK